MALRSIMSIVPQCEGTALATCVGWLQVEYVATQGSLGESDADL